MVNKRKIKKEVPGPYYLRWMKLKYSHIVNAMLMRSRYKIVAWEQAELTVILTI